MPVFQMYSLSPPPRLAAELKSQFAESAKLETAIKGNLKGLGYGF
jgi:type I restriction enzyme M protein